jgi:biopolymer transport protein TolR
MQSSSPHPGDDDLAPLADINVTPFIDVMLVLLIIFMVTAPMMTTGMKVDLPKSSAAKPIEPQRPVVVTVGAAGELQVGDTMVAKDELVSAVKLALNGEERPVQVRGDGRTAYANVVAVMEALSAEGLPKFVLAFEREKKGNTK